MNQNILCASRWPKENICNVSGAAECIKLKVSGHFEGGVELSQKMICASKVTKSVFLQQAISRTTNIIKLKLTVHIEDDGQLMFVSAYRG